MQVIVILIIWTIIVGAVTLVSGLVWMLGLGVLAHIFNNSDLAIGYWQSVVLALFVNLILAGIQARRSKN